MTSKISPKQAASVDAARSRGVDWPGNPAPMTSDTVISAFVRRACDHTNPHAGYHAIAASLAMLARTIEELDKEDVPPVGSKE